MVDSPHPRLTHMKHLLLIAQILMLAISSGARPALAQEQPKPAEPLVHEAVYEAPVRAVWDAFATAEGQKGWNVAHAEVDLRVGGLMRTHYDPKGKLGDAGTIENTVLAYDPMRMLSIKVSRFPQSFPFKKAVEGMWTVLYFEALSPTRTRLTVRGLGFTDEAESQKLRAFFDQGNAYTLVKLKSYLEKKPAGA